MGPVRGKILFLIVSVVGVIAWTGCSYHIEKNPLDNSDISPNSEMVSKVSFQDVYSQVFQPRCIGCHGTSGGVNLETYSSARSFLSRIKQSALDERKMPKAPYPPLTRSELLILAAWIEAGGPETPINGNPPPDPPPPLEAKFESIKSHIFSVKCMSCHAPGGTAARVSLATKEDLINSPLEIVIPGNPEESGLILVLQEGARKKMPPPESGISPVKAEEIKIIEEWIKNGAND